MRSAHLAIGLCLSMSLVACRSEPVPVPPSDGGAADLATAVDLATTVDLAMGPSGPCASLGPCDCIRDHRCAAISSACWCPFPECGNDACACGGGFYYGCAPAAANCPSIDCGPSVGAVGPDARGCFFCGPKPTCADARARLQKNCNLSDAYIGGLTCDKNPDCVAGCMAALKRCDDVGCAFCTTCDCFSLNDFYKCVEACRK